MNILIEKGGEKLILLVAKIMTCNVNTELQVLQDITLRSWANSSGRFGCF